MTKRTASPPIAPTAASSQPTINLKVLIASACSLVAVATGACDGFPKVGVETYGGVVTSEGGESVEIAVTLAHAPAGVVTVYAVSSDESEGRVSLPIQFHGMNWEEPQAITVTGADDTLDDGDVIYDVSVYASASWRPDDQDRLLKTFHLRNRDNDSASFEGLGDLPGGEAASYVSDVSASGDVVVGWSSGLSGERAVRWTPRSGLQELGGPESRAQAVSRDGKLVAGSVAEPSYEGGRAGALWRGDAPFELLIGPMQPESHQLLFWMVDGKVVLDDGRVFGTCIQYGAYGDPLACRFDRPGALTIYHNGHVFAADNTGNFAGTRTSEHHAPLSSQATYNAGALPYPSGADCSGPTTGCLAEARDFAAGGSRIVGTSRVPEPGVSSEAGAALLDTAFVYAQPEGTLHLSNLDYSVAETGAYVVSDDGRVIAGYGTDDRGQQAVAWVNGVPASLEDILLHAGGTIPDGWQLLEVRGISSDARTFAGNGSNPEGMPEGFRIVLPSPL